jgi:hypothetical protein
LAGAVRFELTTKVLETHVILYFVSEWRLGNYILRFKQRPKAISSLILQRFIFFGAEPKSVNIGQFFGGYKMRIFEDANHYSGYG